MPERHVFLAATALLPVVLSLAQAHCGYPGLLFVGGCIVVCSAAWLWQRRHLQHAMVRQLQTHRQELSVLQQQLANQQQECRALRVTQAQTEQAQYGWFVTISQELRTPLNTMIGYSELFREGLGQLVGQELGVDVHMLHEASQQLRRLLQDIRDLASIEAGTLEFCHETFDIVSVVEEVLADLHPLLQEREHTCELVLSSELGMMGTDRPKVRRCLDNLLRHAALLSTQRALIVQVAYEATPAGEWFVVHLHASAPGKQDAQARPVPEQPEHPYDGTLQRYGGSGLGLMLSQRLCQLMGGELSLTGAGRENVLGVLRLPRLMPLPTDPTAPAPGSTPAEAVAPETGGLPDARPPLAHQVSPHTSVSHPTRL